MLQTNKTVHHSLRVIVVIAAVLSIIGCLFIYSASSVFALERYGTPHYFLIRQFIGFGVGLVGLIVCRLMSLEWCVRWSFPLLIATLGLTSLTLVPSLSLSAHGSSRWLSIVGLSGQPSEFLKIAFVLYFASFFNKKQGYVSSLKKTYIPFFVILGLTSIVLLKQPDFGLTVTLCTTALIMFFIAQMNGYHLLIVVGAAAPVLAGLILFKPYRLNRLLIFLNPWNDPQGAGFQVIQSLIAIGSGKIWGAGLTASKQKFFYLPMQHTDFIFAIIAEETGFIGATIVVTLYVLFFYFGVRIAWHLRNTFCSLLVLGLVMLINLQALINILVTTGLLPTKGIGLPFVSYGNSAIISQYCMIGLIMNAVHSDALFEVRAID